MRRVAKLLGIFFSTLLSSASYASYPQNVQVCFEVKENTSPLVFAAGFVSHDVFDQGNYTHNMGNGNLCANHKYNYGPKSIKLKVIAYPLLVQNHALIQLDESCAYMGHVQDTWLESDFINTAEPNQFWNFELTQVLPQQGYKYTFLLKCKHWSN